ANEWCPNPAREWFKAGTQPVERCREHEEPDVDDWIGEIGRDLPGALREAIAERLARLWRR
ncbi:MAG: hypothetical protein ACT4R6_13650, partial [Gemmatimonadaceae bacterium]